MTKNVYPVISFSLTTIFAGMFYMNVSIAATATLKSVFINTVLKIDGEEDDTWSKTPVLTTIDNKAKKKISIQSAYNNNSIFMLVKFKAAKPSYKHKLLYWSDTKERYTTGKEREDTFVFKWNMLPLPSDITLSSNTPYKADVWYWKSARTNHVGFADDKIQIYQLKKKRGSKFLIAKDGSYFYLSRKGDQGKAAYKPRFYLEKERDSMPKYYFVQPEGSRADIKAKGVWKNGVWTIEFERALNTKHNDDVQFELSNNYYFGVSRYEIAGRKPDLKISQPLFGSGEISELIKLVFMKNK